MNGNLESFINICFTMFSLFLGVCYQRIATMEVFIPLLKWQGKKTNKPKQQQQKYPKQNTMPVQQELDFAVTSELRELSTRRLCVK